MLGESTAEFVKSGVIEIIFVRSEDNHESIMAKNVKVELHTKHAEKLLEIIDFTGSNKELVRTTWYLK